MELDKSNIKRAAFYKSHRDRTATSFKKKHLQQFDCEFAHLSRSDNSMSVLEIGCGTGIFLRYLEARGYKEIVGVDMDEGLKEALNDLKVSEIYFGDILDALENELDNRRFDRIVMFDVAEHIQLPALITLMANLRQHLKADGLLIMRVPNIESPWGHRMFYVSFEHVIPLGPGRMMELGLLSVWECVDCFPQEPQKALRKLKERILAAIFSSLLSYHPKIWTANLIAVYKNGTESNFTVDIS